ncbi:MAG: c-type cytochrome domain-containing protein, partial [Polyangiales bacterium]
MRALRSLLIALSLPIGCSDVAPLVGSQRASPPVVEGGVPGDGGASVSFARDIRPIFDRFPSDPAGPGCRACHYRSQATHVGLDLGGLDLSTLGALREGGGTSGAHIVVPGRPEESALIQKLRGTYPFGTRMPKSGPPFLAGPEIELIATWIAQGAKG